MSESLFLIRPAREGDIDILYLLQQLSSTVLVDFSRFTEFIYDVEDSPHHFLFVVCKNDHSQKIVATATILIEPKIIHRFKCVAHIEDVVVDEACRGQGVGALLIKHLVRFAKIKNCYKVILNCDASKTGFYEKCGFEEWGIQMRYSL